MKRRPRVRRRECSGEFTFRRCIGVAVKSRINQCKHLVRFCGCRQSLRCSLRVRARFPESMQACQAFRECELCLVGPRLHPERSAEQRQCGFETSSSHKDLSETEICGEVVGVCRERLLKSSGGAVGIARVQQGPSVERLKTREIGAQSDCFTELFHSLRIIAGLK